MDLLLHRPASRGFFVTGSDTEVGKTWVACALLRSLRKHYTRVGAYKPVASGIDKIVESDAYQLWQASGETESIELVCPQSFSAPLAPPIAARLEDKTIDIELIFQRHQIWLGRSDFLVVEGAGGLFSPIDFGFTNADLAEKLDYPLIVVVSNRLGAVNQSLMAIKSARLHGLDVAAIVLNQTSSEMDASLGDDNEQMLRNLIHGRAETAPLIIRFQYNQSLWEKNA